MANKIFNGRIVNKHDTAENWAKATSFIPKQGEIIVYDADANYDYERFKIGDGETVVSSLPFADDHKVDFETFNTYVSDIDLIIDNKADIDNVVDLESNQIITGRKTFSQGIIIGNNAQLSYDNSEGALRISFLEVTS